MVQETNMEATEVRSLLDELALSEARFHGWAPDVEVSWGLNAAALDLLISLIESGQHTLETGVGHSTVVFAARGAQHTAVSPLAFEHERVRAWCADRSIDLSAVRFIARTSQDALPALDPTPLDVVLIDGDHAFPTPFIDFFFAGRRLPPGGLLVVDDTHLRACRVLDDFLRLDAPRWRIHTELRTTTVFERLDGDLIPPDWADQPWGATPVFSASQDTVGQRLRRVVRLRTRLRVLNERVRGR
jgi:predicted O-methyltransferase YrrM